jgi:FAD/FMN-containing dehydrogenase
VGGLTLGGGISHFANKYGWACDNVESYEVVTASGIIVTASATKYPDLYWALRGGGNNFGTVTKFNMRTFIQGPMWGGSVLYLESEWDKIFPTYVKIAENAAEDIKQAQLVSFGVLNGTKVAGAQFEYSDPTPWPAIFSDWKAIPSAQDTTAVANLSTLTRELGAGSAVGARQTYWVKTFKLDSDLMKANVDTFVELLSSITGAPGLLPVLSFQAITVPAMEQMQQNRGNALGLDASNGPVYIANLALEWGDPADDERMYLFSNTLNERLQSDAVKRGLQNDYLYMNYASPWQDAVASYGADNKQRLKEVASVYDPTGVFQRLQPGYFKLEGAPYGAFPS